MSRSMTLSDLQRRDARRQFLWQRPTSVCSYRLANSGQIQHSNPRGERGVGYYYKVGQATAQRRGASTLVFLRTPYLFTRPPRLISMDKIQHGTSHEPLRGRGPTDRNFGIPYTHTFIQNSTGIIFCVRGKISRSLLCPNLMGGAPAPNNFGTPLYLILYDVPRPNEAH